MKKKTSISLDVNLLKWVKGEIKAKRFVSITHAVEFALEHLKKEQTEKTP